MKKTNTLIVGQGIAGSLIAFMLHRNQIPFILMDPCQQNTSSRIAAGMFSPISGKRKTIHPEVLLQISFAIESYRQMEQLLGAKFLHLQNIYQVHNSPAEQNELNAKLETADFAKYILTEPIAIANLVQPFGAFEITHSGWVDCELMIVAFAKWLKQKDALIPAEFLYKDLRLSSEGMEYHGLQFSNVIFCEGYRAVNNPFFNGESIIPCKGDILSLNITILLPTGSLKKMEFMLFPPEITYPGPALLTAGITATQNGRSRQKNNRRPLNEMLEKKFTIIDHKSAIRPTTQNRAVIAKRHDQYAGMFMLNGLGTKGICRGRGGQRIWQLYYRIMFKSHLVIKAA